MSTQFTRGYYDGLREGVGGFASSMLASVADVDPESYVLISEVKEWIGGTCQVILDNINKEEEHGYDNPAV